MIRANELIDRIERGEISVGAHYNGIQGQSLNLQIKQSKEAVDELLRLAKIGQQMQWVSVAERLPEEGQTVDVLIKDLGRGYKLFRQTDYKFFGSFPIWVTHWMEIPPLPELMEEKS